jgi:hypothetical protein
MVIMKKILTLAITTVMLGALLTGCGSAKNAPAPTEAKEKIEVIAPELKANEADIAAQPTMDSNGQAIDEEQRQVMADTAKQEVLAEKFNENFLGLLYNVNSENVDMSFEKMNGLSIIPGGVFGDKTDTTKEIYRKNSFQLIDYQITDIAFGEEYEVKGEMFLGIGEKILVTFIQNGVKKTGTVKFTLIYNFKGDKSLMIYNISINVNK